MTTPFRIIFSCAAALLFLAASPTLISAPQPTAVSGTAPIGSASQVAATMVHLAAGFGPRSIAPERLLVIVDDLSAPDGLFREDHDAMEVLAAFLKQRGGFESQIVPQTAAIPLDWNKFTAVLMYVHDPLAERIELKMLEHMQGGGRVVALHHTIAGGKAANKHLFGFTGMYMPGGGTESATKPTTPGAAYAWRNDVTLSIVNVNPGHYITSHDVEWPEEIAYTSSDAPAVQRQYPGYTTRGEAYMNHYFTDGREKTVLLGLKYRDDRNGALFMQDRAGWMKPIGRGWLIYLQPGHYIEEFSIPAVRQMILNAVRWQPDM